MRKVLLEMGEHFTQANIIEETEDIFFLEIEEVLKAAQVKYTDYKSVVSRRKINHDILKGYKAPAIVMGSGINISSPSADITKEKSVKCIPLSKGKIKGKAKKINSYRDIFSIETSDIVVIERLNFIYTPLLSVAGGIIIERINPFLSDYTQCRLLGFPAVGGIPGIIDSVLDGEILGIDGDHGIMEWVR